MAPLTLYDARPPVPALAREFMLKAFSRDLVAKGVSTETARRAVLTQYPWLQAPAGVPVPIAKEKDSSMTTDPQVPMSKLEVIAHVRHLAKRAQAADPQLSDEQAICKIFREDHDLYLAYVRTTQEPVFS